MIDSGIELASIVTVLTTYGTWGILILSFIDAMIPLPNVVDGLVLFLSYHKQDPFIPAMAAVVGSTLGTVVFYLMIRSGRRLIPYGKRTTRRLDKVSGWIGRYDFLTIFGAAALPPPFPLKAVVISAGLLRFSLLRFLLAYASGRAIRFFTESILAVLYGEPAVKLVRDHYPVIALLVTALLIIGLLLFKMVPPWLRSKRTLG